MNTTKVKTEAMAVRRLTLEIMRELGMLLHEVDEITDCLVEPSYVLPAEVDEHLVSGQEGAITLGHLVGEIDAAFKNMSRALKEEAK